MSEEKKYRFYYSKKQDNIDEDMWGFNPRFTYVKTPDGYKQYSELCTQEGIKCNWDDAVLVYECDDMPEIIIHKDIPKLINELQHQLKNAIVPKFKIGQDVFIIIDRVEKAKIEKVIYTIAKVDEESSVFYSITDSMGYALRLPEEQISETKEKAKQKLTELRDVKY